MYVESDRPDTVNTCPRDDRGVPGPRRGRLTLDQGIDEAHIVHDRLREAEWLRRRHRHPRREGVEKFEDSFRELLAGSRQADAMVTA